MTLPDTVAAAFVAGDITALQTIYEATKRSIYSVVYRMTGDHHESEDIVHDVFVRAYDKRRLYNKTKAGLHTWIYQMAVNYTLNVLKKKKRWSRNVGIDDMKDELQTEVSDTDDAELALQMLEKINPDFRACIVLCDLEDRPYEEIARLLGISIGTVRSRLNRGRKELQRMFQESVGR